MSHLAIGLRGWRFAQWVATFYPQDLPEDWWLSYYANDFRACLVPSDYLSNATPESVAQWAGDCSDEFEFFIELDDSRSWSEWRDVLAPLGAQLSGLVIKTATPEYAFLQQAQMRAALYMSRPVSTEIGLYVHETSVEGLLKRASGDRPLLCCLDTTQTLPAKSLRTLLESLAGVPSAPTKGLFFGGANPPLENARQAILLHQMLDWA